MMFERHGLKVVGYSAIAPEDIAMFFQNYGIENNETYKELQKQRRELQKTVTKAKKSKWEWRI
jgi:hypothetical protein